MSGQGLLVLQEGANVHRLQSVAIVLGRSESCDLSFDRKGVSRRHCEIVLRADGLIVRDLGSTHGTFIDGSRVSGEAQVQRGAVVRLGTRGPRIRIIDAQIDGKSVPASPATRDAGDASATAIIPRGARPSPGAVTVAPDVAAEAVKPRSVFGKGLLVGILVGAAAGAAALLLLEPGPWIQEARDAIEELEALAR